MADDALADFEVEIFGHEAITHRIFRSGAGPAVVVIAEIPGITPKVADFARKVRALGLTVILPDLFGVAGRDPSLEAHGRRAAVGTFARAFRDICVSREFTVLATGKTSPIVTWLRALAAQEHQRCGGPGVGAVGMCFTGGFALAMATDSRLLVPVLSQPALPAPVSARRARAVDLTPEDLNIVKARCAAGELEVLGLRFRGDRMSPAAKFDFLREQLGEAFIAVELDDSAGNPQTPTPPHSVLTEHLIDEPGQPTREALDKVLDLLTRRLLPRKAG